MTEMIAELAADIRDTVANRGSRSKVDRVDQMAWARSSADRAPIAVGKELANLTSPTSAIVYAFATERRRLRPTLTSERVALHPMKA